MDDIIWMWGVDKPTAYHDQSCTCLRHCQNCWYGIQGEHKLKRYCSDYCKSYAARDRALSKAMSS